MYANYKHNFTSITVTKTNLEVNNLNNKHTWLEPLQLKGGLSLPHRIMPGPLEGVMSPGFCRTVKELNLLDYWITPFIRLTTAVPGNKILKYKLSFYDIANKPVIVQLLGDKPALFAESAQRLQELGISGINLNFGCPSKQVLASNGGGKLLTQPELMLEITNAVIEACPELSVTVKLRTGFESSDEMETYLPGLAKLDIDFIMVHFRTVLEMYDEISDGPLRISQAVKLSAPVPVIASGDIFSMEDAYNMYKISSCAGITIARGLLKDPFLIRKLFSDLNEDKTEFPNDSGSAFFKKMSEIGRQEPDYYKRSSFIEIAKFMWGEDSPKFEMLTRLEDQEMLNFF